MMKLFSELLLLSIVCTFFRAHPTDAQQAQPELTTAVMPLELIDVPIAGTLNQGQFDLGLRVYPNGGVLSSCSIGIFNRLFSVVYYGGENLIGTGEVNWNPHVGIDLRLRVIEETLVSPAIAVGINTQGFGRYYKNINRYQIKSRGMYIVASRNYTTVIGDLGLHGGANFSLERNDEDKDLNFFIGVNKAVMNFAELLVEFDSAINDNETGSIGERQGYLNAGITFLISNRFKFTFYFKDLLENTKGSDGFAREIKLEYRDSLNRFFR